MNKLIPSAFSKIGFLSFLLFLFSFLQSQAQCLPDWEYIRPITVDNSTNPDALTDFQVQFTIATDALITANKMNADGSDIRFTDVACNNLDYWIESGINTANTVIWVEVNNIPANGSATVNMFYGNDTAAAASNGEATFQFFDDFDGTSLNTIKWDSLAAAGSSTVISGGTATITTSPASGSYLISKATVSTPTVTEMNVVSISGRAHIAQLNPTNTEGHLISNFESPTRISLGFTSGSGCGTGSNTYGGSSTVIIPTSNLLSVWSLAWPSTSTQIMTSPENLTGNSSAYTLPSDVRLGLGIVCDAANLETEWARARKYTSPEPNQTVGAESVNYRITLSLPKLEYCPQETFNINYTATGNFLAGNEFIAELSDASGNFGSPVELGRIASQTSGTISATIGENQADGTGYRIRITATNPPFSDDDNGSDITIHPVVTANFDASLACAGSPTSFTDLSTIVSGTIDAYAYQFGNGSISNLKDVNYVYPASGNYDVTLTVTSNQGCADDTIISIEVFDKPTAGFTYNDNCVGASSDFTNTSTGATAYNWNFGDGNTSTANDPSHTYAQPGTYDVQLIAENADGCTDTLVQSINIYANPNTNFTFQSNCAMDTLTFENNTAFTGSGTLTWDWDFDDGNTSNDENPFNVYANDGNFSVELIATSNQGCADTTTKSVSVYPNPVASFVADSVCLGESIAFDNQSSISSGSLSHSWSFGDGNTSTNVQASHTYTGTGTYEVILNVESNNGCMDADTQTVVIYEQPAADFTATTVCAGDSTEFINTSTGSGLTYTWDFGDGNTSTDENPNHLYASYGMYDVTLAIANGDNCVDTLTKTVQVYAEPMAAFLADSVCLGETIDFINNSSIAAGNLNYNWDFGDGSPANTNAQPSHTYASADTFEVILNITSGNGCADADTQTVIIYEQPEALFTVNNNCDEDTTFFMNQSTGSDLNYAWDFGDGNTDTVANPAYVYDTSGTYTVTLTVDNGECSDMYQTTVTIYPRPVAGFNSQDVCLDQAVQFTNTSTLSSGTSNYQWFFGDSTMSTDINPTHLYDTAGIYEVILVQTSNLGCVDSFSKTHVVYPLPNADFSLGNSCYGDTVDFTNLSTIDFGTMTYEWDFSDGTTDTATNPQHLFNALGIYEVTLDVTSDFGCEAQQVKNITVHPVPSANFTFSNECEEDAVAFTNLSNISAGQLSYNWAFSDSFSSQDKNPIHVFNGYGDFGVELAVMSNFGCTDTIRDTVEIYPLPEVDFSANPVCIGETTEFENNTSVPDSGSVVSNFWNFGDQEVSFANAPSHTYAAPGAYDVLLEATTAKGCIDSVIKTVVVHDLPDPTINPLGPTSFCDGDSVELSASPLPDFYNWSTAENTQNIIVKEDGNYQLTVESNFGCTDTSSIYITVWELPNVVAYKDTTISKGYSVYLSATGAVFYEWTPEFDLENPDSPETRATPLSSTEFVVLGTDLNGCEDTDTITINVLEDYKVEATNVITPNGDGVNDFWEIINVETYPDVEVSIYNRYGNELYTSQQYQNDWDGRYNGNDLPEGTYYYTIRFDGSEKIYKGAVSILR
ncbi:MAG: DUF2341 domain-containing protein [Chitinophagales bacterium]